MENKYKKLTSMQIGFIKGLISLNLKYKTIKSLFDSQFRRSISYKTIFNLKYNLTCIVKRKGRSAKTTYKEDKKIIDFIDNNNKMSWKTLKNEIFQRYRIRLSISTIKKRAKREGIKAYKMLKKPFISKKTAIQRISFARLLLKRTSRIHKRIIYYDESTILLRNNKFSIGNYFVKCRRNQRLEPKNIFKTYKYNYDGIKFCCFINYNGPSEIIPVTDRLNSLKFQEILSASYKKVTENIENAILCMDREPTHFSKSTQKFLKRNKIDYFESFPASSPDLNLIEQVFALWKSEVSKENPKNLQELSEIACSKWIKIPTSYIRNLYDSIGRRALEIIEKKGNNTTY